MTDAEYMKAMAEQAKIVLPFGMKLKANMLAKKIRFVRTKCPKCDGTVYATLNGKKNHIHLACDKCSVQMME
jgi:hypothetical protein